MKRLQMTIWGSLKPAHCKSHKPRQFTRPQIQYTYCLFLTHGKHTEIPNRNGHGRDRGPSPRSSKAFPPLPHMRSSSWDPTLLIRDLQGGRVTLRMNPWCCTRTVSPFHPPTNTKTGLTMSASCFTYLCTWSRLLRLIFVMKRIQTWTFLGD